MTSGGATGGDSQAWRAFRAVRWSLALLIVLGALGVYAYWVVTDTRPVCDVTTVTPGFTAGAASQLTRSCRLPDVADFVYVLAVVGVLLLPDARSIKIGSLAFERLTSRVEEQTREISRLSATMSQTVNIGADLIDQLRAAVRQQHETLGDLRASLPGDAVTADRLKTVEDAFQRLADASLPELLLAAMAGYELVRDARTAAAEAVARSATVSPAEEAAAVEAEEVLRQVAPTGEGEAVDGGHG